jgi:hypothetical protein
MNRLTNLETFTRLGFAARGVLYILVGYLAISAGRELSSSGVLRHLADGGFSQLLLGIMALGLLAYGAWRIAEAALDLEGHGGKAKGVVARGGHALSGATHLLLGLLALGLALGLMKAGGGQDGAQTATAWVLGLPGGEMILRLIALGFIAGGLAQIYSAYRLDFLKQLDGRACRLEAVKWSGRLGYAARGIVFAIVGVFLWRAGAAHDPGQVAGTGEALASLSGWQHLLVAVGLFLFGVFSLVQAVYRRITNPDVVARLSRHARR